MRLKWRETRSHKSGEEASGSQPAVQAVLTPVGEVQVPTGAEASVPVAKEAQTSIPVAKVIPTPARSQEAARKPMEHPVASQNKARSGPQQTSKTSKVGASPRVHIDEVETQVTNMQSLDALAEGMASEVEGISAAKTVKSAAKAIFQSETFEI